MDLLPLPNRQTRTRGKEVSRIPSGSWGFSFAANPTEGEIRHAWMARWTPWPTPRNRRVCHAQNVTGSRGSEKNSWKVSGWPEKRTEGKGTMLYRQSRNREPQCATQKTALTVHTKTAFRCINVRQEQLTDEQKEANQKWLLQFLPDWRRQIAAVCQSVKSDPHHQAR